MKILFISREYPPETGWGGIGSYIITIAPALAKRGHDVHVLSCADGQGCRDYMDQGVSIHRRGQLKIPLSKQLKRIVGGWVAFDRFQTGMSIYYEYRRLGISFDVLEYPDWGAEGWCIALLHKKPLICTLHTPLPIICRYASIPIDRDRRWASFLEHFAIRHADVITSPSEILIRELSGIGWLNGHDVKVIPNPVDLPQWADALPIQKTEPVVLYLGQLYPLKAPELLVEAMSIIRKDIPEAKALFIGGNNKRDELPYKEWIRKSYEDLSGCEFIEKIPRHEAINYISKSRVFALPARYDNFSMSAIELMAAGRPVVVSANSGVAELINKSGGGRVVPPGDPVALADALRPFLSDVTYAATIGDLAKDTVRKWLDPNAIAAKREQVYREAITSFHR